MSELRRRAGKTLCAAVLCACSACDAGDAARPVVVRVDRSTYLSAVPARRLRRLSRREYDNVVRDLLGDTTQPASAFGPEVCANGFDNGSESLVVQSTALDAFRAAAESVAQRAVDTNLQALLGPCDPSVTPAECVDTFFATFPQRAYRRPPTVTELGRLHTVYAYGSAAGDARNGLRLTLEAILQSPAFLYREELGVPDPRLPAGFVRLPPYEVASEISFLVTGSMPDAELLAAAAGGRLASPTDYRREASRLLAQPAAKSGLRAFLHEWLSTNTIQRVAKDPVVYPAFTPALATAMAAELDDYFDDVLWTKTGSLRELFTSSDGFVDDGLAALYGVAGPSAAGDPLHPQPVQLDRAIRRGVLTRAGFLASHADSDSSGPVARGVFVLGSLLCTPPAPPPPNVPALPPPGAATSAHTTTRQRFDAHLSSPTCRGCHSVIDGVGFGFEQFDGIGAYRTTENGSVVDTGGTLYGSDVNGPFVGVAALESKLASSKEMIGCFLRRVVQYETGQSAVDTGTYGPLHALEQVFTADTRITDAVVSLVTDPAFVVRSTASTGY
jgi:hypothetical protein